MCSFTARPSRPAESLGLRFGSECEARHHAMNLKDPANGRAPTFRLKQQQLRTLYLLCPSLSPTTLLMTLFRSKRLEISSTLTKKPQKTPTIHTQPPTALHLGSQTSIYLNNGGEKSAGAGERVWHLRHLCFSLKVSTNLSDKIHKGATFKEEQGGRGVHV